MYFQQCLSLSGFVFMVPWTIPGTSTHFRVMLRNEKRPIKTLESYLLYISIISQNNFQSSVESSEPTVVTPVVSQIETLVQVEGKCFYDILYSLQIHILLFYEGDFAYLVSLWKDLKSFSFSFRFFMT